MKNVRAILAAIIIYFIFASLSAFAIETVRIQNNKNGVPLGYQLQYLFDENKKLTLEEIRSEKYNEKWNFSNQQILSFGLNEGAVWVRVRLKNYSEKHLKEVLMMPQAGVETLDLYVIKKNNKIIVQKAGTKRPYSARPIQTRSFNTLLDFKPKESMDVYIRAETTGTLQIPLSLWDYAGFLEHEQTINFTSGLFFGAMLIMLLYNLIVYFELKEKTYLYFVIYIAALTTVQLSITNYGFQYLWYNSPWFESKSFTVVVGLLIASASQFVKGFLTTESKLKTALNLCIGLSLIYSFIALFLDFGIAFKLVIPLIFFAGLVGFWTVISIWLYGTRVSKFLVIGWSLFLSGGVLLLLSRLAILESSFLSERGLEIGAVLEILFLSLALVEKIKEADEKRDIAQRHLLNIQQQTTNQLEVRVKDRTSEIESIMKKLESANKKLTTLSAVDGLTQLNNRTYFDGTFEAQWKHALRSKSAIALLLMDIDNFKRINDEWGHLIGDECLKLIADAIKAQVVRETDTVARYGGEEFVVLLPHISIENAKIIAEKIRKNISTLAPEFEGEKLMLTISIGLAMLKPSPTETTHDLIQMADLALYKAKKEGRNRVVVADDSMRKKLEEITKI